MRFSVCLPVYLSTCLPACLPACLPVCLSWGGALRGETIRAARRHTTAARTRTAACADCPGRFQTTCTCMRGGPTSNTSSKSELRKAAAGDRHVSAGDWHASALQAQGRVLVLGSLRTLFGFIDALKTDAALHLLVLLRYGARLCRRPRIGDREQARHSSLNGLGLLPPRRNPSWRWRPQGQARDWSQHLCGGRWCHARERVAPAQASVVDHVVAGPLAPHGARREDRVVADTGSLAPHRVWGEHRRLCHAPHGVSADAILQSWATKEKGKSREQDTGRFPARSIGRRVHWHYTV